MMLENESGVYEETNASEWPTDGYVFNEVLSKCENGGILSWDNDTKKVVIQSNKSDKCYVYFDKYNKAELNVSVNKDDSSITVTVTSTDEITKYYYSKDGGSNYVESPTNTYTFTNLDSDTAYQIKIYGIDSNGQTTKEYNETIKTDEILTLANYIKNTIYSSDGVNGLYYHDGQGTYTNANQEAGDKSYRYSGANPNNYVCFGSDASTCPEDNLYRIIGLFDDDNDGIYNIKLIKLTIASSALLGTNGAYRSENSYYWNNYTITNNWSESNLNKINLNTNYWNNLGSKWRNLIVKTVWKVGGNTRNNLYNTYVKNTYQNEIVKPAVNTTYSDEIGLIYLSDYGYAVSPEGWKTNLADYDNDTITTNNWMFTGDSSVWTITRMSDSTNMGIYIFINGQLTYLNVDGFYGGPTIKPVFYLNSNATLVSGDGTRSNPYRISA